MDKKTSKLGKGLGALLGDAEYAVMSPSTTGKSKFTVGGLIKIDQIEVNPFQPRSDFQEETIEELATSIKTYGLIQPVTVREIENGKYQLISGERRWRASILAGLTEIPAFIRTADDLESIQMALVENIQREDLNAIEIAISFQRLIEECNLSQEELSEKVGKDRSTIANYLRLLKLSLQAQIAVRDNKISMGHARALVALNSGKLEGKLVEEIIKNALSVRQTEALVKKHLSEQGVPKRKMKVTLSTSVTNFKNEFSKKINSKISIVKDTSGKGKISISFTSEEDLERIIKLLNN